ncbi:amino acid adenylation domain-containing protein [Streptomyces apocyni]|uniref:amino acid adenylation domain-containing protein n=1 Tax=Streptomyces apocyni TaxID=2654677 RepID=UPI0018D10802|nr:amino acid adenylation domain-containing protein [Streptomyces apocyni]
MTDSASGGAGDDGTLTVGLARSVREHPGRPAVRDPRRQVSYAELDEISNSVASLFLRRGLRPGARIGVWLNKSVEAVAAIHAVLRAGAAYVPLDPTAPPRRVARVLADSDAAWLITTPERAASLRELVRTGGADRGARESPALLLVGDSPESSGDRAAASWEDTLVRYAGAPRVRVPDGPDDVAYILYTSGSTGAPKGVVLTHGNARAFVDWAADEFSLSHEDVLASHAPLHFDLSVLDLFGASSNAACVSLVPDHWQGLGTALLRFVADQRVTVWYSVPTALRRMAEAADSALLSGSRLRVVAFAGEEYPVRHLRQLAAVLPKDAALYNLYGPTETNVCTYHRVGSEDLVEGAVQAPPIGRMCPYATSVLLDRTGLVLSATGEATVEATGELCVAGGSVMRGYWNDVAKTAHSTFESDGVHYYRTGDIVRRGTDGQYTFVGRDDGMVKVKGHRIELGEIEAALDSRPEVREAVCLVAPGPDGQPRLVAFVTAASGTRPEERGLRRHCRESLPGYMVPERIETVPALSYTSTGKVDRRSMARLAAL